jgi:DNA-directed RNA polymerase subunit M/transcription elongation factor TFIIS
MAFAIIHEIKDIKNINILLTCPICLKSLKKESDFITDGKSKKLLTYDKEKKLIIDRFKRGQESYTVECPYCHTFSITYENKLNKIRDATNDDGFLLEDKKEEDINEIEDK